MSKLKVGSEYFLGYLKMFRAWAKEDAAIVEKLKGKLDLVANYYAGQLNIEQFIIKMLEAALAE